MTAISWLQGVPLSMAHLCEIETPPAELITAAAAAGLSSVGVRLHPVVAGGPCFPLESRAQREEVRNRIADTGVEVLFIEFISINEATRAADYARMLETGAELGASRLAVAGDVADFDIVADRLGEICDLAQPLGITVEVEFMSFRAVRTVRDAATVIRKSGRPNAQIMLDALHLYRSGGTAEDVTAIDPALIGSFQLCDAPAVAPTSAEGLVNEARKHRLFAGDGGLALEALLATLPEGLPFAVEVPMAPHLPGVPPAARLRHLVSRTRDFLSDRSSP